MAVPRFRAVATPSGPAPGSDAVVLGVRSGGRLSPVARRVLGPDARHCQAVLDQVAATGQPGELNVVALPGAAAETVLLVGVGASRQQDLAKAGANAARRSGKAEDVLLAVEASSPERLRALIEGYALAAYSPARRGTASAPRTPQRVAVASDLPGAAGALRAATATATAVHLARDLANTPANEKSPAWLAAQAVRVAEREKLSVRVRDEHELLREGFGGLIGVGRGSARPPRLVELGYVPSGADGGEPHVVLVGKGIVFDSGGISIKPAAGMESMKTDMAGAAAVLGVMSALRQLDVPVRVTGLLAVAENLPGADAQRPSDVISPYGGLRTVEVINTDAEGRLVLADALAYADLELDPDIMVDIATLTGAISLALGRRDAGLFASDDGLAATLERGRRSRP